MKRNNETDDPSINFKTGYVTNLNLWQETSLKFSAVIGLGCSNSIFLECRDYTPGNANGALNYS